MDHINLIPVSKHLFGN